MIDKVYKTVNILVNKEIQGYVSPDEFNTLANTTQLEIFREYFEDANRDKNRENRGLTNGGYSNLAYNQRQRIEQFASDGVATEDAVLGQGKLYTLPEDLYFIEQDGLSTTGGQVIEEVERKDLNYLMSSMVKPTELNPVYERQSKKVKVYPSTLTGNLPLRYLRTPKMPKWTFFVLPDGNPAYNPSAPDFQDLELHESEFSNIVIRLLSYFGINLREQEVIQVAEKIKQDNNIKDNG